MKELKENIQMEIHLLQKKREYRRKKYHMVTHFTRCCGKEKRMLLISFGVEMESCPGVSEQIYNNFSKEIAEIEEKLGKLGG